MTKILARRLNLILSLFTAVFLAGYILFSGLSTSLDFKIEKITREQTAAREEYEQLLAALAQAQSREVLLAARTEMNLVEVVLADGYLDLRPPTVSAADVLAKTNQ